MITTDLDFYEHIAQSTKKIEDRNKQVKEIVLKKDEVAKLNLELLEKISFVLGQGKKQINLAMLYARESHKLIGAAHITIKFPEFKLIKNEKYFMDAENE